MFFFLTLRRVSIILYFALHYGEDFWSTKQNIYFKFSGNVNLHYFYAFGISITHRKFHFLSKKFSFLLRKCYFCLGAWERIVEIKMKLNIIAQYIGQIFTPNKLKIRSDWTSGKSLPQISFFCFQPS